MPLGTEQRGSRTAEYKLSSSELITALKTLPLELYPQSFKIMLDLKKEEEHILGSTAILYYVNWEKTKIFLPKVDNSLEINFSEFPEQVQETKQALLIGKKPARVLYEAEGKSAYGIFLNEELEQQIIKSSYQIKKAELCITVDDTGEYVDTAVSIERKSNDEYSVDMTIGEALSPENKVALKNWYSSLSSLHPVGQVVKSE